MEWYDLLQLIAALAMGWCAYANYKRKPRPVLYAGKQYYPRPDGTFETV